MDNERNGLNMTFRYFPTGVYLLKISFVVLLFLPSSTEKPNFYPVNSCTDIKLKDIPIDVFQKCSETSSVIHCLPDENNNMGLSCFQVTWISKGKCPSYNSYQVNMDEKDCSTDYHGTCPVSLYKSPLSVLYTGCYINELTRPTTTPTAETMNETNQIQLSQSCDKHLEPTVVLCAAVHIKVLDRDVEVVKSFRSPWGTCVSCMCQETREILNDLEEVRKKIESLPCPFAVVYGKRTSSPVPPEVTSTPLRNLRVTTTPLRNPEFASGAGGRRVIVIEDSPLNLEEVFKSSWMEENTFEEEEKEEIVEIKDDGYVEEETVDQKKRKLIL